MTGKLGQLWIAALAGLACFSAVACASTPRPRAAIEEVPVTQDAEVRPPSPRHVATVADDMRAAGHAARDRELALHLDAAPSDGHHRLYEGCGARTPRASLDLPDLDRVSEKSIAPDVSERKARHIHIGGGAPSYHAPDFVNDPAVVAQVRLDRALRAHTGPAYDDFLATRADTCAPLTPDERVHACEAARNDSGPFQAYFLRCDVGGPRDGVLSEITPPDAP